MTKVIICSNTFETTDNGPAKFLQLLLANNLDRNIIDCYVLTEDIKTENEHVFKLNFSLPKYLRAIGQFYRMFLYAFKLRKLDKIHHFDKIIFNNSYQGLIAYFCGFNDRIIGMVNDYGICELKFKKDFFISPNLYIYGLLERLSIILFPKIIVNSNFLKKKLVEIINVDEKKIFILYKGIKVSETISIKDEFKDPINVVFVKSDFKTGGLYYLIHALGEIKKYNFNLKIIGPQPRFHSKISEQALEYKNLNLELLGFKYQTETLFEISKADIFCVPSIKEAFGVANIEAMNIGISLITTNVGGIPEVVKNNSCAWIVPPNNIVQLREAFTECIENVELRNYKRLNAFNRSLNFNFEYTIRTFIKIVE
jgi:colanic acid/amylovoran biosynthesis glycosyltransferase